VEALRRVLGISQPATVRLVDRLAAEGLVERRAGADRRSLSLHLTAAGEEAARGAIERRTGSLRALLDVLEPTEQAALAPLLERLVSALADDRAQALRVCRLCDRRACTSGPGCPLDHTAQDAS
jgi:DNA-binding MarR family transcriptional regulator